LLLQGPFTQRVFSNDRFANAMSSQIWQPRKSGVDVMITIFCDFYPFSAKKLAFFSKTNVMITIFAKTSFVLHQKRQYFR
jgi:hypothetical protein